ncbi:OmpA family protein [Marinivivus vitaminiproducens]|uniref:OmpA family protein n=1 Tax=Marinivivus vitaminiproducens TaxID=3035935 RepID=UPI002798D196|nr:OmpA family protein [Geminicoccaceae bacterium SCSIO 64248]
MPARRHAHAYLSITTIRVLASTALVLGLPSQGQADQPARPSVESHVAVNLSTDETAGEASAGTAARLAERERRIGDLQIRLIEALQAKAALERRQSAHDVAARLEATPALIAPARGDPIARIAALTGRIAERDRAFAALSERAGGLRLGLDDAEIMMTGLRDALVRSRHEADDLRAERDRLQARLAARPVAAVSPEQGGELRGQLADARAKLEALSRERDVLIAAQAMFETAELTGEPVLGVDAKQRLDLERRLASAEGERDALRSELAALRQPGDVPATAMPDRAAPDPDLVAKMAPAPDSPPAVETVAFRDERPAEPSAGTLGASTDRIDFAKNSAELRPGNEAAIDALAAFVLEHPDRPVLVRGHTDSYGDAAYNRRLSARRAETIKRILVDRYGLAPERISVEGMGASQPVAGNETADGRRRNRRVEVLLPEVVLPSG